MLGGLQTRELSHLSGRTHTLNAQRDADCKACRGVKAPAQSHRLKTSRRKRQGNLAGEVFFFSCEGASKFFIETRMPFSSAAGAGSDFPVQHLQRQRPKISRKRAAFRAMLQM